MGKAFKVVIVRDRLSAGGGIHNYYQAIAPHLSVNARFVDVGKPQGYYGDLVGIEKLLARSTLLRLLIEWMSLAWVIVSLRPAIVHVNPGMDAFKRRSLKRDAINILIAKLLLRKTIVFWRGWEADWLGMPEFPGGNHCLLARIYHKADAHIVLCSEFRNDLRKWGFNLPIHLETTVGAIVATDEAVENRTLNYKRKNLLFLSRIEERKGIYELYEAFCILRKSDPSYTLTFAGDGPDLKNLRKRCSDDSNVSFAGFVSGSTKVRCFEQAAVFCFLSSYGEGMPNAVLEAIGMGLPIVSSSAGGLKDLIVDGESGYIIPEKKDDPQNFRFDPLLTAKRITELLCSPERYAEIASRNIKLAKAKFTAPVCAGRLERIYRSTLAGDKSTLFDY